MSSTKWKWHIMWYEEEKSFSPHLIWTVTVTPKKKSSIIFCSAYFNITKQTEKKYNYINKIFFLNVVGGSSAIHWHYWYLLHRETRAVQIPITLLKSKCSLLILKLLQAVSLCWGMSSHSRWDLPQTTVTMTRIRQSVQNWQHYDSLTVLLLLFPIFISSHSDFPLQYWCFSRTATGVVKPYCISSDSNF